MIIDAWTLDWFIILNLVLLVLTASTYGWRECAQRTAPGSAD